MKKRLVSILLSIILASGTIPVMSMPIQAEEKESNTMSGQCGYSAYWSLSDDGVLSITGSGSLYLTSTPWNENRSSIKEVKIDDGITQLPDAAFSMCDNLEKVTLPNSLKSIFFHRLLFECLNPLLNHFPHSAFQFICQKAGSYCF